MALQIWLPLNGNLDNYGLANVAVTNHGATVNTAGKIGQCYYFNGGYLSVPIDFSSFNVNECSMCVWVKFPTASSGNKQILNIGTSSGWTNIRFGILYRTEAAQAITSISDGSVYLAYHCNATITENQWNHIAAVYSNKELQIYVNGVLANISTTNYDINFNGVSSLGVGAAPDGAEKFTGYLNDVRIYNHALSPKEVKLISQGLVLHYPLNRDGFGADNIIPGTSATEVQYTYPSSDYNDKFSATTSIVPSASQYVASFWAKSTVNGDIVRMHWYSPNTTTRCESSQGVVTTAIDGNINITLSTEWKYYWVVYTQSSTTAVKHFIFPRMGSVADQPTMSGTGVVSIKGLKLEEGNIPTPWVPNSNDAAYTSMAVNNNVISDVSGYGHNGDIINSITYVSETPRYAVATHFGATNQKIHISNFPTSGFGNSYSFAWWAKRSANSENMDWGFSDGIRLNGIYTGVLWNTGDGAQNPLYVPGTTTQVTAPSTGVWHHYVMTGDGTTCKVYLDGELWAQAKTYKAISGTSIYINGWDSGTSYCSNDLTMSDFRIYATALSADDVQKLYRSFASVTSNGSLLTYSFSEL